MRQQLAVKANFAETFTHFVAPANLVEVEAKFKVADPQMFWQLQTYTTLRHTKH